MSQPSVVHSHPEIVSGEPVFIGTRVPARTLVEWIEGGQTVDEFLENFPSVTRAQAVSYLDETLTMRTEYDFSGGIRGKYAGRVRLGGETDGRA